MPWSLVEILSGSTAPRRAFYLPLASIAPGSTTVRAVAQNVFTPSDETVGADDKVFNIRIAPPFSPEGSLPDPAFRLHAMAPGSVRFEPQDATMGDRLILEMPMFLAAINAQWWQRWVEALCLPYQIIYENVDRIELEARLQSISLLSQPVPPLHGLSLPAEIMLPSQRDTFITHFLAGTAGYALSAESGAVIGTAATDPAGGSDRLLKLRARYHGHTDAAPRIMNPREFLHLLFGNDSAEFTSHPLFLRIDAVGLAQPGLETNSMRLRPPLRTFGRLEWEANLEMNHQNNWTPAGTLGTARMCNVHSRDGHTFNRGTYAHFNKCNLFTSDIALRAGFRAAIHDASATTWHYIDANSHANLVHNATGATDRVAVMGRAEDAAVIWAWNIENWIRAQPIADLQARLNELLNSEGRCLVLAGARARRFLNRNCGGTQGICNCGDSLRRNGIGHILLVREVLAQPTLAATVGHGIQSIRVLTLEASGSGAESRDATFQTGGAAGAAAAGTGFIRLHLFELHPGGDPNTLAGLRKLNIRSSNSNLIRTANEAAADRPLNLTPAGMPRTDNRCCRDQWPTTNTATDIAC